MKRFKNILLVADRTAGGEEIFRRAVTLAKTNRAQLTVAEVIEELPADLQIVMESKQVLDMQEIVVRNRLIQLTKFISTVKGRGGRVTAQVLYGTPFLEIIKEVIKNKHDLVIVTAGGKGGLKEILFGSTTLHLMRKCPCPVWAIKPADGGRFSRILAAVDPVPSDKVRNDLNIKIVELASSLARSEKSELHIVHTWQVQDEYLYSRRLAQGAKDLIFEEVARLHKTWFKELLTQCSLTLPTNQVHLLEGEAGIVIPELSRQLQIPLIVMGTVARAGISGMLIGNTAEKVLLQVDCSVLAVKPEGYVSPVVLD